MATTTIRVEKAVHKRLAQISRETGRQLVDVVSDATDALERIRFAEQVRREMDALRDDEHAWSAYLAEFDLGLSDGIT